MYKKIIAVFSAAFLVMTVLTACNQTPEKAAGAAASSSSVVSSQSGSSSVASSQSNSSSQSAASSAVSSSSQTGASSFPVPEKDPLYVKAYGYYAKDAI